MCYEPNELFNADEYKDGKNKTNSFENIEEYVEQLEMKLQMTLLQKMSLRIMP